MERTLTHEQQLTFENQFDTIPVHVIPRSTLQVNLEQENEIGVKITRTYIPFSHLGSVLSFVQRFFRIVQCFTLNMVIMMVYICEVLKGKEYT